jgi:hypothetical protein
MAILEMDRSFEVEANYYTDANNFEYRLEGFIFSMASGSLMVTRKNGGERIEYPEIIEIIYEEEEHDPTYTLVRLIAATLVKSIIELRSPHKIVQDNELGKMQASIPSPLDGKI